MPRLHPGISVVASMSFVLVSVSVACGACGGSATGAAADPDCPFGQVRVVSCGGEVEACVTKPSSSCDAFNSAQPPAENPCRFGNRFTATCSQVEPGTTPTVRCACS
jgi:hypothetical protein